MEFYTEKLIHNPASFNGNSVCYKLAQIELYTSLELLFDASAFQTSTETTS